MKTKGFTLVEMMVVVLILSLVAVFLTNYLLSEQKQHKAYDLIVETRNNVLSALNLISQDLRMLGADPNFTDRFGLWFQDNTGGFQTDSTRMIFTSDINPAPGQLGDGSWNLQTETFGFYLQGDTIFRPTVDIDRNWTPQFDHPLVSGITNLTFSYRVWDEGLQQMIDVPNPTPAQIDNVMAVDVTVAGQSREILPTTHQFYTFTGQTRVTIRTRLIGG
ncbi:MAG TPA: prepilin-type N-terminal cleavage/methylation domain-containing protein [bacterium (Candidatus Stahlbacteria)]|nr:prepilin-type N-terminal cleavage/methylation domain-containing protein [Candidatus Stahlbacteria bacterium]